MTAFKICGLTRPEDAAAAGEAGAAALGVIFAPSPRQVDVDRAAQVLTAAPDRVARVGVFARQPLALIEEAVERCRLDWVQLSGGEPDSVGEAVTRLGVRLLKAVHLSGREDLNAHADYPADALLLDAPALDGRFGGTGQTFDWSLLEGRDTAAPIVIAGGLHPGNVAAAVHRFRPAAVDVCSGVEAAPGIKDPDRIRAFADAVRLAEERNMEENGIVKGIFA